MKFPLTPEVEKGNVEYKLYLDNEDHKRIDKISAQMMWRLNEGKNKTGVPEAIYFVGVCDNGIVGNQTLKVIKDSVTVLEKAAKKCGSEISKIEFIPVDKYYVAKVIIRTFNDVWLSKDIRVAFVGPYSHGKSTLIGTLTYDHLDDGDGSGRCNVFKYSHEMGSGDTSSIKYEIIGFRNDGTDVNYASPIVSSWEDIVSTSDKVVSLIDLPGKPKYLKTTYFGLLSCVPDHIFIVIDATKPTEIDQYKFIFNLGVPYTIVFTKQDLVKKIDSPYPIIPVSNVTGHNISKLKQLLFKLKKKEFDKSAGTTFIINSVTKIQDVGIVISGVVLSGVLNVNDKLLIGPFEKEFKTVTIESIHRKQVPCKKMSIGENGTIVIKVDKSIENKLSKHLMIVSIDNLSSFVNQFKIKLNINYIEKNTIMYCKNTIEQINLKITEKHEDYIIAEGTFTCKNKIRYVPKGDKVIIRYDKFITVGQTIN